MTLFREDVKCEKDPIDVESIIRFFEYEFGKKYRDSLLLDFDKIGRVMSSEEYSKAIDYIFDCPDAFFITANKILSELGHDGYVRMTYAPPYNIAEIQDLHNVNTLVKVRGLVTRATPQLIKPLITFLRCPKCANLKIREDGDTKKCPKCKTKMREEFDEKHSIAYRIYTLQDVFAERKVTLEFHLFGDITKEINTGDVIDVVGIVRTKTVKVQNEEYMKYYLFGVYARHVEEEEMAGEEDVAIDGEYFVKSIAPHIYGYNDIKLALALQMLNTGGDTPHRRERIHILLLGDPGTAKTQLLNAVTEIMPKSFYVVAHGTTNAGLGGAVVRDEDTGEAMVDPGVLVLADKSVVAIDELDKVKEIPVLMESMERGTVTVAKAGKAQFNARAAILAAANPAFGRYKPNRTFFENFSIPLPLYSRFDLIFVIMNNRDREHRRAVARAVLDKHMRDIAIDVRALRKFVLHARRIKPIMSMDMLDFLVNFYDNLCEQNENITPRQLETLIRLAKAHARLRRSEIVVKEDVDVAVKLFVKALQSQGFTLESFDAVMLETGVKSELAELTAEIYNFIKSHHDGVSEEDIYQRFDHVPQEVIRTISNALMTAGRIYQPRPKVYKAL